MSTAKEFREFCDKLCKEREEDLKSELNNYFESIFISRHKPWRAVIGNKRCTPIPIPLEKLKLLNLSEEAIRKALVNLGFVITCPYIDISVTVPPYEKGKKLSFAQECVKKINYSYSEYCKIEKDLAEGLYSEYLSELTSTPTENIKIYGEYILFSEFEFSHVISSICHRAILSLLKSDGIEELYENGEYKGIKVLRQPPN